MDKKKNVNVSMFRGQNSNFVTSTIDLDVNDVDDVDDSTSTGAKTISSPPVNSFVSSTTNSDFVPPSSSTLYPPFEVTFPSSVYRSIVLLVLQDHLLFILPYNDLCGIDQKFNQ
jgi:hypothetical protein